VSNLPVHSFLSQPLKYVQFRAVSDKSYSDVTNPLVLEATSSVIYAAPHTDSRGSPYKTLIRLSVLKAYIDLQIVKDILTQRLGTDFARAATVNQDNYVSPRV
jgi:hypothetical protein